MLRRRTFWFDKCSSKFMYGFSAIRSIRLQFSRRASTTTSHRLRGGGAKPEAYCVGETGDNEKIMTFLLFLLVK